MLVSDRGLTGRDEGVLGVDLTGAGVQDQHPGALDENPDRGADQRGGHRVAGRTEADRGQLVDLAPHRCRSDERAQRGQRREQVHLGGQPVGRDIGQLIHDDELGGKQACQQAVALRAEVRRGPVALLGEELLLEVGVTPVLDDDVDLALVYDGFTFNAITWLEALGFCGLGEAQDWLDGGRRIALDGDIPVNPHGGQLSEGRTHGFGFIYEAIAQLRHDAGDRQVADARTAVVTSGGGTPSGVLLLRRD